MKEKKACRITAIAINSHEHGYDVLHEVLKKAVHGQIYLMLQCSIIDIFCYYTLQSVKSVFDSQVMRHCIVF